MRFTSSPKLGKPPTSSPKPVTKRVAKESYTDSRYFDDDKKTRKTESLSSTKEKTHKAGKAGSKGGADKPSHFNAGNRDENRKPKKRKVTDDAPPWDDTPRKSDLAPVQKVRQLTTALPPPVSKQIMIADQSPSGLVSPEAKKALESRFGSKSDLIVDLIETDNTDGATTLIFKTLLQSLVEVLPITEHAVRVSSGSRGVYQFNQVVSQMRELLADIQSVRDRGMLGNSVVERHVRPAFMDIAVQIVQSMTLIEESARTRMSREDFKSFRDTVVQDAKKSLANYIQRQYAEVAEAVITSLS